jgi:uncharacterized protein YjgD (DUF1641 family)
MKNSNLLLKLNDVKESIDAHLLPIIPSLKTRFKDTTLTASYLKRFNDNIHGGAHSIGEAVGLVESYLKNVKEEIHLLEKYIQKNDNAIAKSMTKINLIEESIQNLSGVVMYSSDLLASIFLTDNIPPAKTQEMIKGMKTYSALFTLIDETDIVDTIENVPAGLSPGMIAGFLGPKNLLGISGFIGSPFYTIGKFIKQWEFKKIKLLESRASYMRAELLSLELESSSNPKIKQEIEYHKEQIAELEDDIANLQD